MFKKAVKILAIVVVAIILLNIALFITFSIPRVQKYAANIAIEKLKPKLKTEVSIKGIRIKLFNTVVINGLYVEDQQQDTLLYVDKLSAKLAFMDLFRNSLTLTKVGMENFVADVNRADADAPFNFQFIIDAFAKTDTTQTEPGKPLLIRIDDLVMKNGQLSYNILSEPETSGLFNPNHLVADNFNLRAKMRFLNEEDMRFIVSHLTLQEHSGLVINDFDAVVVGEGTLLTSSGVRITLNNSDISVTEAKFDTKSKAFALTAKSETIDPKDLSIFVSNFSHFTKPFAFEAELVGELPSVEIADLIVSYGSETNVKLSGSISDVGQYHDCDLDIKLHNVSVSQSDLENIIRVPAPDFISPEQLVALGNLAVQLNAKGRLSNFGYQGVATTEQGKVFLSGKGRATKDFSILSLTGPVRTTDIRVANIIGDEPGVGDATLTADVSFNLQKGEPVSVEANGNINRVFYKGFRYNNLIFDGKYSGTSVAANVNIDSKLNKFDLFADLNWGAEKKINVKGAIDRLDIRPFFEKENWIKPSLTTQIEGGFAGSSIDDMVGRLVLSGTSLSDSTFIYNPGPIYLQALADIGEGKKLQVYSSIVEGEVIGDYYFTTVVNELMHALYTHLPSVIKLPKKTKEEFDNNNFRFNFSVKNTEDISYALSLPFYNVEPATISGSVNLANNEKITLNAHIPRFMLGKSDIRETRINANSGQLSGIGLNVNSYLVQDNGYINARLNTRAESNSVFNNLFFDVQNKATDANGELKINMDFLRDAKDQLAFNVDILPSSALLNGENIYFDGSTISYRKDSIEVNQFGVRESDMLLLGIDGVASIHANDNVRVYFNETKIENILSAFNINHYFGSINGNIYVYQALQNPIIQTDDLRIENIAIYTDTIGTLRINGDWDNINKGFDLNAYLINENERSLEIKGFVPTGNDCPREMEVKLDIRDFALTSIQPLATGVFSELKGSVSSSINITGSVSEPILQGWFGVDQGVLKVDYTNVTYRVSDTIQVESTRIGADNLQIRDDNGNLATLTLSLLHTNFGRMVYNAHLHMDDFLLLNNKGRTDLTAYGLLKLTGDISLTGSPTGIFGEANLRSTSHSNVEVVIPQTATAQEYSGVVYINTPQEQDSLAFLRKKSDIQQSTNKSKGINIPINIRGMVDINPMLQVGVTINPTTGDAIDVRGYGEVSLIYNSIAIPSIRVIGDYVISEGDFKYNVAGLRTVNFGIREGSTLTMIGDPLNTQFNIVAYNRVNADLGILHPSFRNELANTRVPVDAILEVRGNLDAINLAYNIELPEASNDIIQRVRSFITTDESRIRQFGNLVLLGNFYSSESSPDLGIGTEMFTSVAANTLSKGLDMLFASVFNENWQIGTILETRDGSFDRARMGLDISGRLFDNRLRVSGNFTYGDNTLLASQQEFLTEFTAMWDINSWLTLRAYNQANDRFYRRAPYTQGVGVVLTKEGETLYDLFRFKLGRKGGDEDK